MYYFYQFTELVNVILGYSINNWKMTEMFQEATNSNDIDFIGKEEFVFFALNNIDMIKSMIKMFNEHKLL